MRAYEAARLDEMAARQAGDGDLPAHVDSRSNDMFLRWHEALHQLTSGPGAARMWRRSRYQFAHRLGEALTGATRVIEPIRGPAIYGVWLPWGLLYIGQTLEAERRLRDLPIGESHHLANTFPPEIWHKVVVVAWPRLAEAEPLAAKLPPDVVGLALEHLLQDQLRPLANSERRTPDGGWRNIVPERSRSRGARTAHQVTELFQSVSRIWDEAASRTPGGTTETSTCRVVFPQALL
jgi:hypothetical protein